MEEMHGWGTRSPLTEPDATFGILSPCALAKQESTICKRADRESVDYGMLERRPFDLIEGVSRSERDTGRFVRALLESMLRGFGDSFQLLATAEFHRQGSRYEIAWSEGEPLWDLLDRGLSCRNLHRHLSGQPWWIQRGFHRKAEDREDWYDLIFIPGHRELRQVLGLITSSVAGQEGATRNPQNTSPSVQSGRIALIQAAQEC